MIDRNVLEETEQRYAERKAPRETTQRKIETRPLSEVDTPERVEKRMERLGLDAEAARAVSVGEALPVTLAEPTGVTDVEAVALERVLGKSDLLGVSYFRRGLAVANAVGRIRIRNDRGRVVGFGTGFMVSPRLVLTNNHVLRSQQDASFSQVEFNFQDDERGRPLPTFVFDLDPAAFFITDAALDFSIVAVRDGAAARPLKSFGFCKLIEAEGKILLGEYASIIQHPNGEAKQLALRENQVIDLLDNFMHYQTDTAPGSSGSAVFNDQWEVVALHHSGVPKRDAQKRVLATDGKVWTEAMGEQRIAWIANEGVRISRIIKRIKAQSLTSAQRVLRNEIFEAEPPRFVPGPETTVEPSPSLRATGASSDAAPLQRNPVLGRDGSVSWTIPLTVSFQVGTPADAYAISTSDAAQLVTSPASVTDAGTAPAPADGASSPSAVDLREALAELEAARTRTYYDAARDRSDRRDYYAGLPGSRSPAKLYEALHELLLGTHKSKPKYKPATHVYPWVDLQPNGKIKSVYSGMEFDAEEFIREDFRIDHERAARFRESLTSEAAASAERMAEELDLLEAQLPYNCEHVVPQSWFSKREPMRGDIHHLFACESDCNSFRGNIPYFDFPDFEEVVREACGKRETNRFEPTAGKGVVARATLYFLLRYPGEINASEAEYIPERLKTLLKWHRENPVNDYERHRNAAIFAVQGNRNPFIDFPQWARKTDLKLGLG